MSLPDAPATPWDPSGKPEFGTYVGECVDIPAEAWFSRLDRIRRQKRWLWIGFVGDEVAVGAAIVRTGYAANVFCWVFDRLTGEFVQDVSRVLPRPAAEVAETPSVGRVARYRALFEGFEVHRDLDVWTLDGTIGDVRMEIEITEHALPVTAICDVAKSDGRHANITRKQTIAHATGSVRAGVRRFDVSAPAFIDHSHGMLTGETVWQWAIGSGETADGRQIGFNFVDSFNDGLENAIWRDGTPSFAGPANFTVPDELGEPWRVAGESFELQLQPEGVRAQELDLGVIASDYLQPLGVWRGEFDGVEFTGVGVAEFHRSVW